MNQAFHLGFAEGAQVAHQNDLILQYVWKPMYLLDN